jgi:hypothetical protein
VRRPPSLRASPSTLPCLYVCLCLRLLSSSLSFSVSVSRALSLSFSLSLARALSRCVDVRVDELKTVWVQARIGAPARLAHRAHCASPPEPLSCRLQVELQGLSEQLPPYLSEAYAARCRDAMAAAGFPFPNHHLPPSPDFSPSLSATNDEPLAIVNSEGLTFSVHPSEQAQELHRIPYRAHHTAHTPYRSRSYTVYHTATYQQRGGLSSQHLEHHPARLISKSVLLPLPSLTSLSCCVLQVWCWVLLVLGAASVGCC